ncbi:hypothetical protein HID58_025184 [Brassica napus]|uniref:Uncharacterized protein n=1 Tax=Brassica napus TaxID=3708 RepID=A0ABQ8CKA5_BRANA|nr:hypothetical protein HID58_025184 [Brassica napus]
MKKLNLIGLGQSLVVIDVVFLVAGLPSIVSTRLGFQDQLKDGSTVCGVSLLELWFLLFIVFVVLRWHERLLQTFIELVLL